MKRNIVVGAFLLFTNLMFSQTTTFNYLNSSLSTSACNVFNPFVNINSIPHISHAGGVSFSTTNGLGLATTPKTSPQKGTAFVIGYTFSIGSKYSISIVARGRQALTLGACVLPNLTQFATAGNNLCVADPNVSSYTPQGIGRLEVATTTAFATYNIPEFEPTATWGNLIVWAKGGSSSLDLDVLSISSITITKTPNANFSLSPSISTLSCGSTTPVTFTVTNGANTPNVTNHAWNLGNNNGWLFNGNPAPATISTGTTDTLTLTPDCGKALSNVSATVTAGGNNFNTNTTSVSVSQPTYSISGSSTLCSGSTNYSITGLVCNSTVAWSSPPSNLVTLSSLTASSTTLTATGTSGNFILSANVTSCGVTTPVTLPVKVGAFTVSDYTLTGGGSSTQPLLWCSGRTYSFAISGPNPSNIVWTPPSGWTIIYNGGSSCVMRAPGGSTPPSDAVSVSFTEPCGTAITKTFQTGFSTSACTGTDPRFTFSPNPAPTSLNVAVASAFRPPFGSGVLIRRIQIIRIQTGMIVFDSNYGSGVLNATISTSAYAFGNYTLRIFDGTIWAVYQFVK